MSESQLLEFPCEFPVKVFGRDSADFEATVLDLVRQHAPEICAEHLRKKPSSHGNYVAITVNITARSQTQLDAIYHSLSASDAVLMAL